MNSTLLLLTRASMRRIRQHWLGSVLLVSGIALATAVFIAVLYASFASVNSFEHSTAILGRANSIELRSRSGEFSEEIVEPWLRNIPATVDIFAALESSAEIVGVQNIPNTLTVVGIGLVASGTDGEFRHRKAASGTLFFSEAGLAKYGLQSGGLAKIYAAGRFVDSPVATLAADDSAIGLSESTALCDLGGVQRIFGKAGRLSSLMFNAPDSATRARLIEELTLHARQASLMGVPLFVQTDESRRLTAERLLSAFRSNIFIMVAMTFLVCILTIFNAAHLSTLGLQQEYRVLKTLGVSRSTLFASVIFESVVLGAIGSALGLTFGRPLTMAVSSLFLGTVQDLYLGSKAFPALSIWTAGQLYATAFCAGLFMCCCGAVYPAWRVSGVASGFSLGGLAVPGKLPIQLLLLLGVGMFSGGIAAAQYSLVENLASLSQISALMLIASIFLFSAPLLSLCLSAPMRGVFRMARTYGLIALSNSKSSLGSHAFTVGVGASAVSLLIALSVMVGSFRSTLHDWVNFTFRADIYMRPQETGELFSPRFISPTVVEEILNLPELAELSRFSSFATEVQGEVVSIAGADIEIGKRRGVYHILSGSIESEALANGEGVMLSETAAHKLRLTVGNRISFEGRSAIVVAIYQDFSSERGHILTDLAVFKRWYPQIGVLSLGLYLRPGANAGAVQKQLLHRFSEQGMLVTLNSDLRAIVFRVFDQTFKITALIRIIVVLICGLGFTVSILQLMQERRRELKTLYTLGMPVSGIQLSFVLESLVVAIPSIFLGVIGGTALALLLIQVINPISFGWSFQPVFEAQHYWTAAVVVLVSNVVAALIPAHVGSGAIRAGKLSEE